MPNKEEKETEEVTGPPDVFIGKDNLENYMHFKCIIPSNPIEAYTVKRKCIEFGKELLPSFIDPDETDEEQIKKNQNEQEKTDALYAAADTALTKETIDRRKTRYKYLDDTHWVYELTATDADECEALEDGLKDVKDDFKDQQHEQHMSALEKIDNEIFHVLSMHEIVLSINPTLEEMKEEHKKQKFRERHKAKEIANQEGNGGNK